MKQNKYKPEPSPSKEILAGAVVPKKRVVRGCLALGLIALMSLGSIWIHDAITQCPIFTIKQVEISGTKRVGKEEIIKLAGLTEQTNLFEVNLDTLKQQIVCHPWIATASIKRALFSTLMVTIVEQDPLAVVNIENLTDIIINTNGQPFKEYDPQKDQLHFLPVISGVDLTQADNTYHFEGPLFNSIMDLLEIKGFGKIKAVMGDDNIGIIIQTQDIYNKNPANIPGIIPVKLGFDQFEEKRIKALEISRYIGNHFPDRTISAMDLYNIEKIFITTKAANTLHHNLEKGA